VLLVQLDKTYIADMGVGDGGVRHFHLLRADTNRVTWHSGWSVSMTGIGGFTIILLESQRHLTSSRKRQMKR
jgi:hypothetical protein